MINVKRRKLSLGKLSSVTPPPPLLLLVIPVVPFNFISSVPLTNTFHSSSSPYTSLLVLYIYLPPPTDRPQSYSFTFQFSRLIQTIYFLPFSYSFVPILTFILSSFHPLSPPSPSFPQLSLPYPSFQSPFLPYPSFQSHFLPYPYF